ncbi:MAG: TAXI family TRAP transporter solute-binding subunit [Deltaproteobacteria bacterium]|nr:TAXI family TRAP transporter solute-binding subunit [Deltaproteobacteria bacterium]
MRRKKRFVYCVIVVAAILSFLVIPVQAQTVKNPVHLRLASMDLGSAWYVYGATFAKLWRGVLPKGSTIDVLPYGGAPANVLLVEKGDAEVAFCNTTVARWAIQGKVAFPKPVPEIRGMVGALDKYYLAAVATKSSGITNLEDVAKKKMPVRIVTQPTGSSGEVSLRLLLEAYGITYDDIKSWGGSVTPTSTGVASNQMIDGKAHIWVQVIVAGHPAISELAISTDVVFLPYSQAIIDKLENYGFQESVLPEKTFKGQDQAVPMVGYPSILIAHRDLNPELAYVLTKSIVENKEQLVKAHAGFKNCIPEDAWKMVQMQIPLHPGAEKYYRERGWMK